MTTQTYQYVPKELQQQITWLNWKQLSDGRKVPVSKDGNATGYDDPAVWLPIFDAIQKTRINPSLRLGISLTKNGLKIGSGYLWCLDFDGFACGSEVDDGVIEFFDRLATYVEESPSGTGFKAFFISDKTPQVLPPIKFGPSEFAEANPDVKKYSQRQVEIFVGCRFLAITGVIFDKRTPSVLRFIPEGELDSLLNHLNQWAIRTDGKGWGQATQQSTKTNSEFESAQGQREYAKPLLEDMSTVLLYVDADDEQVWSDTLNGIARTYGNAGRDMAHDYSKRSDKYGEAECNARYDRALREVANRPEGLTAWSIIQRANQHPDWPNEFEVRYENDSPYEKSDTSKCNHQDSSHYSQGITAAQLSVKTFKPLMWIVKGILPEGCYLLSARPKVGKSWLALQISLAVAFGLPTLGRSVVKGKSIYLALEENQRRLQDRLQLLRPQGYATPDLLLFTDWPAFDNGGLEKLIDLIHAQKPKLLVIDTLAKVRPATRNNNVYENDYKALAPLTKIANSYRCCIVIVTHNRKGKSDSDALEQISGSLGLSGAVDGALVIDGVRADKQYKMSLIGRDIPDDDEIAISRQSNGEWQVLGNAKEVYISDERKAISDLLALHTGGLKPKEVADLLDKKPQATRKLMFSMALDQQLINNKGNYTLPTNNSNAGVCGIRGNSSNSGNSGSPGNYSGEKATTVT